MDKSSKCLKVFQGLWTEWLVQTLPLCPLVSPRPCVPLQRCGLQGRRVDSPRPAHRWQRTGFPAGVMWGAPPLCSLITLPGAPASVPPAHGVTPGHQGRGQKGKKEKRGEKRGRGKNQGGCSSWRFNPLLCSLFNSKWSKPS